MYWSLYACVLQILYKAKAEDVKHKYTMSPDLPEFVQAKCNAYNISDVSQIWVGEKYRYDDKTVEIYNLMESWKWFKLVFQMDFVGLYHMIMILYLLSWPFQGLETLQVLTFCLYSVYFYDFNIPS